MNAFTQACHKIVPLTPMAETGLSEKLEAVTFNKGDYLVRPDKVCHHFYFLESGLVSAAQQGREIFYEIKMDQMEEVNIWMQELRRIWETRFDNLENYLEKIQKS